jgi:3-hydroxyisobutyrate dehydrogenase
MSTPSLKTTIGVVGLGRMGANMARHLRDQGFRVAAVLDSDASITAALADELKATACAKLADVTRLAKIIITVVTDDSSQLAIFTKKGDNLLIAAAGRTFINCATVSPSTHLKIAALAQKAGASSLEACMASSITQARNGTLYLMCGGDKRTFTKVRPVLESLSDGGKLLRHIGSKGQAAQVKALVNMVMNINTAALAEGLGLGDALGLDLAMLREVFSQTGANSRVLVTDGEDMVNRDHACFFSAQHAAKDSGIALSLATKQRLQLPLATATLAQYQRMVDAGLGHLDKSGIAELTFKGRGPKRQRKPAKTTKK